MESFDPTKALRARLEQARSSQDRSVIAVVGTGVSMNATGNAPAASWRGLLEAGINFIEEQPKGKRPRKWDADEARATLDRGNVDSLLQIATEVEAAIRRVNKSEYKRWLDRMFGSLAIKYPDILKSIGALGVPIATTNYDSLLELELDRQGITWRDYENVDKFLDSDLYKTSILHLHGHYHESSSVILGKDSYKKILGERRIQTTLQSIFRNRDLIFIGMGSGLEDPNFGELLDWAAEVGIPSHRKHYLLVRNRDCRAAKARLPMSTRIEPISYGEQYEELLPYLSSLLVADSTSCTVNTSAQASPPATVSSEADSLSLEIPSIPQPKSHLVVSNGLLSTIATALEVPGTIEISAEGGFGKTEVARLIAQRFENKSIWIDCGKGYLTEEVLLLEILDGLHQQLGVELKSFSAVLKDPKLHDSELVKRPGRLSEGFIAALKSELTESMLLVFDDLQDLLPLLRKSVIATIIENKPHNLKLIFINRQGALPELSKVDKSFYITISREQLVFNAEMVEAYFHKRFGQTLSKDVCQRIATATSGWPMALATLTKEEVTTAPSIQEFIRSVEGIRSSEIYEALLGRAYQRLDAESQKFLKIIALTREITPRWLNYVAEISSAGAVLWDLHSKNVFLERLDQDTEAWKLHSLFKSFLVKRFRDEDAEGIDRLVERSLSYLDKESTRLTHVLDALDHDRTPQAAASLEKIASLVVEVGNPSGLLALISRIPSDIRAAHPILLCFSAQALAAVGRVEDATQELALIKDWATVPAKERHFAELVRLSLQVTNNEEETLQKCNALENLWKAARLDGQLIIAAQAAVARAEILSPYLRGDIEKQDRLIEDLHSLEQVLKREKENDKTSIGIRAHLLATIVRRRGHFLYARITSAAERVSLRQQLGNPIPLQDKIRELQPLLKMSTENIELARQAMMLAEQSKSELTLADVSFAVTQHMLDSMGSLELLNRDLPVSSDQIARKRSVLQGHYQYSLHCAQIYQKHEMIHNLAMSLLNCARIAQQLDDVGAFKRHLADVRRISDIYKFSDVIQSALWVEEGRYDPRVFKQTLQKFDPRTALAHADDEAIEIIAKKIAQELPDKDRGAAYITIANDMKQHRSIHRARVEVCKRLSYLDEGTPNEQHNRLQCTMYPLRKTQFATDEFETLLSGFRLAYCASCANCEAAPVPPTLPV